MFNKVVLENRAFCEITRRNIVKLEQATEVKTAHALCMLET
jgi:hypothetical protein